MLAACRAQTEICQSIFKSIHDKGRTTTKTTAQLYSTALQKFLADRYVTGTCPKCGYEDARGDQCDGCGTLLNPTELKRPKCKFSGTEPVLRETTHIFLDLPQLEREVGQYVEKAASQVWHPASLALEAGWFCRRVVVFCNACAGQRTCCLPLKWMHVQDKGRAACSPTCLVCNVMPAPMHSEPLPSLSDPKPVPPFEHAQRWKKCIALRRAANCIRIVMDALAQASLRCKAAGAPAARRRPASAAHCVADNISS